MAPEVRRRALYECCGPEGIVEIRVTFVAAMRKTIEQGGICHLAPPLQVSFCAWLI